MKVAMNRLSLLVCLFFVATLGCESAQQPPRAPPGNNPFPFPPAPDVGSREDATPPDAAEADAEPQAPVDAAADAGPERDVAVFEQVAYAIETRVGERRTPAGLENRLTCEVLDLQGAPIPGHRTVIEVHPDTGFERTVAGAIGRVTNEYTVTCTAPDLGLRDPTPAAWGVTGAGVSRVEVTLDDDDIQAGELVTARCDAFDAFGNPLPSDAATLRTQPPLPGFAGVPGQPARYDTAGVYDVSCALPGAESGPAARLTVRADLPAALAIALAPDRGAYRVGAVVELVAVVTDRRGNAVPAAPVVFESEPPLPTFGDGRFRCAQEGRYTLTARVDGPTHLDRALSASVEILVDYGGPGIRCEQPEAGGSILRPAEGGLLLRGSVGDIAGLSEVRVDGQPAALTPEGAFSARVETRWGLNVHNVIAVDAQGNESAQICTYFAADAYLDENTAFRDAVTLRLGQSAVDDGEPDAPLTSLVDVLRRVVNSRGLRDTVHQAALAQNPIVPNECRVNVLGLCLFSLGVDYTDLQIGGRNALDAPLVPGGLRTRATIRNLAVSAQLRGTLGNRARISTDFITIGLTFNVGLRVDGQPTVSLRSVDAVDVGRLDSDFSGFISGAILELVFSAFEGLIRRTVTNALRDFLEDNLAGALRDLLGNVEIGDLSQGFDVPGLAGADPVRLTVTPTLSTIDFAEGRALVGVSTRVDGPSRLADRSPGVPLPPGPARPPLAEDRPAGAGLGLVVLNQVLHRLWRAGWFEAQTGGLVAQVASDLPEGAEVTLSLDSAPAVVGLAGDDAARVRVFFGPARAGVVYPGFFVDPFRVTVAATLDATMRVVNGRDVEFVGVQVAELHLGLGGADLPDRSRQVLEDSLRQVVQGVVDRALNDGLPSLPLPEFVIPDSLGVYDLPAGAGLGLRDARLFSTEAWWMLDGRFGQ
jgi:hypothetical protein